ncbi:MAG: glycosyltransferase family A protein [Blastocatellia bacterium]
MRVGANPAKTQTGLDAYGLHRIIVPVYIPRLDGYFQHAIEVLNLCLESLRVTASKKAAVTIVFNGCAPAALEEMERRLDWVDQIALNRHNRGKIDAVVSAARGCFEPLITIADCDMLFRDGWIEAVEELFQNFPECGYVCPFPSPAGAWHCTSATMIGALAGAELSYEKVVDDRDLDRFARSIGRPDLFKPEHRDAQWIVRRKNIVACVGAGHYACTIRREVLAGMPDEPSLTALDGRADMRFLDLTPDRLGFWRLSTPQAWVNHMGNIPEEWMREELAALIEKGVSEMSRERGIPAAKPGWTGMIPVAVRGKIARLIQILGTRAALPARRRKVSLKRYESG